MLTKFNYTFTKRNRDMKTLTHIRVYKLTRDKINGLADKWETTQAEAVDRILTSAESVNFDTEPSINKIENVVQKNANRIIGFLKTQDKNLLQVQDNILYKIGGHRPPKEEDINAEKKEVSFYKYLLEGIEKANAVNKEKITQLKQTNGRDDFRKMTENEKEINSIVNDISFFNEYKSFIESGFENFVKKWNDAMES